MCGDTEHWSRQGAEAAACVTLPGSPRLQLLPAASKQLPAAPPCGKEPWDGDEGREERERAPAAEPSGRIQPDVQNVRQSGRTVAEIPGPAPASSATDGDTRDRASSRRRSLLPPEAAAKSKKQPRKSAAAAGGAKKSKKPSGPSVSELLVTAVSASKERSGVSLAALKKALAAGGCDVEKNNSRIKVAIRALVTKGTLTQVKGSGASGSFKLNKKQQETKDKAAAKKKKPAAAKKPAATAAKKPAKSPKKPKKAPAKSPKKAKKPAAAKKAAKSPKKPKAAPKKLAKKAAKPKAAKSPAKKAAKSPAKKAAKAKKSAAKK
ncbi:histone H1A-like [Bufo bufo]|uniref:histone H1A-like n=1 Tax=Bufo bufo TaxID=8384 RepID=UPI001ABE4174|nr:histone H1A-like [Bufo bufo]